MENEMDPTGINKHKLGSRVALPINVIRRT